jgi:hypothetical protein
MAWIDLQDWLRGRPYLPGARQYALQLTMRSAQANGVGAPEGLLV